MVKFFYQKFVLFSFNFVVTGNLDPDPGSSFPKGMKGFNADPELAF
jgi:hypothetical protein